MALEAIRNFVPVTESLATAGQPSAPQLEEMRESRVTLVVPKKLHDQYPPEKPMELLTLASFVETVRGRL